VSALAANDITNPKQQGGQTARWRWPHPLWLWSAITLVLLVALALWPGSAAAQNQRATTTIKAAISVQPDAAKGKALYARQCASCHGRKGYGVQKSLTPALAGQVATYTIKQLVDAAEGDRRISAMHSTLATQELLSPAALANVAGYIEMLEVNERPQEGSGQHAAKGAKIYALTCARCHGVEGAGNPSTFTPALRGQHYSYLLTQMRQLAASHRYAVDPVVIRLLEALSLDQIMGLADVASRLSDPRPGPFLAVEPEGREPAAARQ
jgi:cytochrome c553